MSSPSAGDDVVVGDAAAAAAASSSSAAAALTAVAFTDPFDPHNIEQASLGMEGAPPDIVGVRTVSSLLPGDVKDKYNTFDCHKRALQCTVGNDFTCIACRTLGGGICTKASQELKTEKGWDVNDPSVGVCLSFDYGLASFIEAETVNPFTTTEEAFVGVFRDGSDYIALRRGCIDNTLVRKDPDIDPKLEGIVGCTDVVMCGEKGAPIHPVTGQTITDVDDIDFDISQLASTMDCLCDDGYESVRDDLTGVPTCDRRAAATLWQESSKAAYGCPVRFSVMGVEEGCLSDPALHVRVATLDASLDALALQKGGVDYGYDYMVSLKRLKQALDKSDVADACLPRPGVDPRVAAIGYSYAAHLFSTAPELTAFKGGHLVTGGLLRRSAMTENGTWHSWIENADEGKHVTSESLGGVVPYVGTGSVAAHVTNGDDLSTNGLTGPGGYVSLNIHPNASMRVVPVPWSTIPGVGKDSMDHAVGMVASQGRVYPNGVYERMQYSSSSVQPDPRGATETNEASYLTENDSPLKLDRACHDSGICSAAFVVPRKEGKPPPYFLEDPAIVNAIKLPLKTTGSNLIMRKKAGHTPLERIFDVSLDAITDLSGETSLTVPGSYEQLNTRNDSPALWDARVLARSAFGKRMYNVTGSAADTLAIRMVLYEYKGYGGFLIQPVTTKLAKNGGKSSMFARFAEDMLSENSPKIIDHYKTYVLNGVKVEESDLELFPKLPVASRIASNESSFFSGRGLSNGLDDTGMTETESHTAPDAQPDVLLGAVLTGDSVLMNGDSCKITRPLNVPCSVFPETLWHERRAPARQAGDAGSATVLARVRNAFWRITGKAFAAYLNADVPIESYEGNENTYCPSKPYFNKESTHPSWFPNASPFLGSVVPAGVNTDDVYDALTSEPDFADYVGSLLLISPAKFSGTDMYWQQGSVTESDNAIDILPTPMPLFEALMRVKTPSSENFIRSNVVPHYFRADWAENTHSAGNYMMGHHSPPSLREETGKTYGYPCSGALAQFMTLLVPRVLAEGDPSQNLGAHSNRTKQAMASLVAFYTRAVRLLSEPMLSPFDMLAADFKNDVCNCTSDVFCPRLNAGGRDGPVAGVPSRCNRNAQFLLSSTLPKNDVSLTYALLMAQAGDIRMSEALEQGAVVRNGHQPNLDHITGQAGWHSATTVPFAPNRWRAARSNRGFTPYSSRLEGTPATFLNRTNLWEPTTFNRLVRTMGSGDHNADMPDPTVYNKDDMDGLAQESTGDKILNRMYVDASRSGDDEIGAKARRKLDFFENATGTAPSTFNVGMFNPYIEGARDVVVLYGTPIMTDPTIWWETKNREGRSGPVPPVLETETPLPSIAAIIHYRIRENHDKMLMRRIFTMPVNVSSFEGFACGLTAAEATCTRGTEIWYKNKTKPPMNRAIGTSREGLSSKAPEPFDELSVAYYSVIDRERLQKYANHHHFGFDGLMSIKYADRLQHQQLYIGSSDFHDDLYAFPFACQSDRRPWPLTKEGYTSRTALVDMGVL